LEVFDVARVERLDFEYFTASIYHLPLIPLILLAIDAATVLDS